MSLDNVLAVAGAAKGSTLVLVIGLAIAIVLMAVASHYIANLLVKYPWITWIGLLDHPLGGPRHDLQGLARGDVQAPSTSVARRRCGRASCTDWG